jgi:hypothetical protein
MYGRHSVVHWGKAVRVGSTPNLECSNQKKNVLESNQCCRERMQASAEKRGYEKCAPEVELRMGSAVHGCSHNSQISIASVTICGSKLFASPLSISI